ncbi:MAG: ATP-binding protein [Coriobacteriales bacterium]|nr:ATP-binding protein [Coriobacteriales bacterium]MDO4537290.1 ATP-binding protein [Coriobacteriales bacterium]
MATGEQIKALIKAHYDQDNERFRTAALRIAASETRAGHTTLGREITSMVDASTRAKGNVINLANKDNLFLVSFPETRLSDLIVSPEIAEKINRVLTEYRQRKKLASFGLSCRRKLLLEGNPGTGKTMTAAVVAAELDMPLFIVQIDKLITKYLGETSARLRQIFETIANNRAVYLFDEFDAIGADRGRDNEVGEMRRILNSFLQFIEADTSESIIIAATNNKKILDQALFRRFDDVMHYELPTVDEVRRIVENRTGAYDPAFAISDTTAAELSQLCQADITRLCEDAMKESLLSSFPLSDELFQRFCADRLIAYGNEKKAS